MSIQLRAVFMLIGISCIGAFHPMPGVHKRQMLAPRDFSLLHATNRETKSADARPCAKVAEEFNALITFHARYVQFDMLEFFKFVTSIDLRDQAALNEVVCNLLSSSTDEFVSMLRSSGIERHLLRRLYDLAITGITSDLSRMEPGQARDDMIKFFQIGFVNLDPEGVAEFKVAESIDEIQKVLDAHHWVKDMVNLAKTKVLAMRQYLPQLERAAARYKEYQEEDIDTIGAVMAGRAMHLVRILQALQEAGAF
ncbi:hypothetical protein CAPTEDRAFT_192716 [Capitella teleta]|uniref:Uncharacterized protein n=1 Tax=Capitella teleta TaxID=283909 RepID=R7TLG2_CAPTE|nr:hypothetical protein CAPTEDRAFT_192716 [Capitella teleta]|eukprot:ELT92386.1 hypothetical protein CAPTEDRAFT_192716 [Capitella teleta]